MGLLTWIKGVISRMFAEDAEKAFGIDIPDYARMDSRIAEWSKIYKGYPEWLDKENNIKTIKMAKAVCTETARLTTLALDIEFDGGARADYLKKLTDNVIMPRLRGWVEYACALGTVILKPTDSGVDMITPDKFRIIHTMNGQIDDIVFQDGYEEGKEGNKRYYTKLERHSFLRATVNDKDVTYYHVENKAFVSKSDGDIGKEINLKDTRWSKLQPDVYITKKNDGMLNNMLFGVLKMPSANDIDWDSPLGMSIFADAIEELKDLDIAYSRNAGEIEDSQSIILVDDRLLSIGGKKAGQIDVKLPHYVHNVYGADTKEFYQEIDRTLKTEQRIVGINNQLSFIGYKCGYSNGYFVFDQKSGMITATQVEADDRRTIQLIKDIRDCVQNAIEETLYALSVFADLYNLAPVSEYEANFNFGDITYNYEEDKQHHYDLAKQGKYPWEEYYVEYLGYSREDAKKLLKMAQEENKQSGLFEEE